jgi:mRNA-degrading endonuclease RelE of RelBE toxin-antitoxin system
MVFKLQLSRTAQKSLDKLPSNSVKKIFTHTTISARLNRKYPEIRYNSPLLPEPQVNDMIYYIERH